MKRAAVVVLLALSCAAAWAQTLKVLTAGALKPVVLALVPAFEARSGLKVEVQNDTAGALQKRIEGGEAFDVALLPMPALERLAREGRVDGASVKALARVGIGVAVKAGAPEPPLQNVEQFKAALAGARRIAYIDPASGGSSGIYLDGLFRRLGIADTVLPKAVLVPGGLAAGRLVNGEADLALQQISELVLVPGARLVGPLPEAVQNYTVYGGAAAPKAGDAARAFIAAFEAPDVAATLQAKGLEPVKAARAP